MYLSLPERGNAARSSARNSAALGGGSITAISCPCDSAIRFPRRKRSAKLGRTNDQRIGRRRRRDGERQPGEEEEHAEGRGTGDRVEMSMRRSELALH